MLLNQFQLKFLNFSWTEKIVEKTESKQQQMVWWSVLVPYSKKVWIHWLIEAFLCGICMFAPDLHGFSPGILQWDRGDGLCFITAKSGSSVTA